MRFLFSTLIGGIMFFSLAASISAEEIYFYHTDAAGTPLAMTNASGVKVWEADYMPFGEEYSVTGSAGNDRRFVGKEKDEETGLNYFGARYLSANVGRFLAPDEIRAVNVNNGEVNYSALVQLQRSNLYTYSLNNPFYYIDPDGKSPKPTPDNGILSPHVMGGGSLGGGTSNSVRPALPGYSSTSVSRPPGARQASNANAQAAMNAKLSALEKAQQTAVRTETLSDGRVRYYGQEVPARTSGPTRGAAYVTEYDPRDGGVRSWMESYDHTGKIVRVHPKMLNGQALDAQHYPPTARELGGVP